MKELIEKLNGTICNAKKEKMNVNAGRKSVSCKRDVKRSLTNKEMEGDV